jgi:hypothetical protein
MLITDLVLSRLKEFSEIPLASDDSLLPDLVLAKCAVGQFQAVSTWLCDKKPPSHPGTDFRIGPFGRHGDYDFTLIALTVVAKKWLTDLSPAAGQNLLDNLLVLKGPNLLAEKWFLGLIPESENHLLLSNVSCYLTNEVLHERTQQDEYDNGKNGVHTYLMAYLGKINDNGFYEYNSKPYSSWSIRALQFLYSYTVNEEIKTLTRTILDRLFFKYASQTWRGYLSGPFRRRHDHLRDSLRENDTYAGWLLAFTDYIPDQEDPNWIVNDYLTFILAGRVQSYMPPQEFLDLALDKSKFIWARAKHSNLEVTYREPSFAIFGGGHSDLAYPIPTDEDAVVRPTCLLTDDGATKMSELLRFEPKQFFWANNTGVYRNFACGLNPAVPANLTIKRVDGNFLFMEVGSCYVALRHARTYGCFEVVDRSEFEGFEAFCSTVVTNNQDTELRVKNGTYRTTRGDLITFDCTAWTKDWLIQSVLTADQTLVVGGAASNTWPSVAATLWDPAG